MSKADTLGPAPAFSAVRSARRNAISKIGEQGAAETVTELPVTVISENPDNPRNHLRNLDETESTVRELGIIMPIVVATAEAYLRERPERAGDLDDGSQYVVVDGHRRLECARRIGLATIPVRVDNARVATDEALLEAAFVANYHRDDMTDLEEAHALKTLVDYYGSQTKAAKRLGIPQGTISSKLSLLKLSPELQKDLVTGARKVEHVRNLGKLSPLEQKAKADERAAAERRPAPLEQSPAPQQETMPPPHRTTPAAPAPAAAVAESAERASGASAVAGGELSRRDNSVPPTPARPAPVQPTTPADDRAVPEQGADPLIEHGPWPEGRKLPYDQPVHVAWHLFHKMTGPDFVTTREVMADITRGKYPHLVDEAALGEVEAPE